MKTYKLLKTVSLFIILISQSFFAQQVVSVSAGSDLITVRDQIRSMNDNMTEDIIVELSGGMYFLNEKLVFDSQDSPSNGYRIIWKNKDNELPEISGGVPVSNWQDESNGIISASVDNDFKFRQLYVNNEKAEQAKFLEDVFLEADYDSNEMRFVADLQEADDKLVTQWNNLQHVELDFSPTFLNRQVRISSIVRDETAGKTYIYLQAPPISYLTNLPGTYDLYFQNALEFVDEPGEWYLDETTNTVYYKTKPGETAATVSAIAPSVETLLEINGAENLVFFGLCFEHSTWVYPSVIGGFIGYQNMYKDDIRNGFPYNIPIPAAIYIENSNNIQFERNIVRYTGGTGLMAFDNNLTNLSILGNVFYKTSAAGLQLGDDDKKGLKQPEEVLYRSVVQNNYFYKVGHQYYCPVVFGTFPYQLDFKYNEMTNSLAMGLNLGWGGNAINDRFYRPVVKQNKFDSICRVGTDASVYHTRNFTKGALISENWFDNTIKVYNFRRLGRYTSTINDPKFGNLYLDNDCRDNNFVRNVHTNFSTNGYGPQLQNKFHIFGDTDSPNYIVDEFTTDPDIMANAGIQDKYIDIKNYLTSGSIGGNKTPSPHIYASYLIDDRDGVAAYSGSWFAESSGGINRNVGGYLNTYTSTNTDTDELTLAFEGEGIEVIAPINSQQGLVEVYIDDVFQESLDLTGAPTFQKIVYQNVSLDFGNHILKIVKNGGIKLQIDAFHVFQSKPNITTTEVDNINHKYDYESGVPADHISLIDISTGSQLGCPSGTSNQHLIHNTAAVNQTDIDIDDIDVSGILDFYLDVTAEQTTKNFRVEFRSSAGNFATAFDFAVGSIRFWQPGSPTTFTLLASYVVGTKYRFHVTLDNLNDLADIEIFNDASGTPIVSLSDLPFRNSGSHVIDAIRFTPIGAGAGTFNIDNFIADDEIIPTSELFDYGSCTTSLSISDIEEVNYVNIYPNPTKGYVTLSTKAPADVPTIIDILGRKVSANITKLSQTDYQVDMSKLPSGVYFLRVALADKKSIVKRIVKQ